MQDKNECGMHLNLSWGQDQFPFCHFERNPTMFHLPVGENLERDLPAAGYLNTTPQDQLKPPGPSSLLLAKML
jgi:hypothetical protein